jgi:hypothetical protein
LSRNLRIRLSKKYTAAAAGARAGGKRLAELYSAQTEEKQRIELPVPCHYRIVGRVVDDKKTILFVCWKNLKKENDESNRTSAAKKNEIKIRGMSGIGCAGCVHVK